MNSLIFLKEIVSSRPVFQINYGTEEVLPLGVPITHYTVYLLVIIMDIISYPALKDQHNNCMAILSLFIIRP